jgi:hypothetical protein
MTIHTTSAILQKFNKIISFVVLIILFTWNFSILAQDAQVFKYFVGTAEPPADWHAVGFDDSDWPGGYGSIGYGDGDDSTLIDTTTSLYLRFAMDSVLLFPASMDSVEGLVLDIDYDDGFVAYLNGNEILRINMDEAHDPPLYTQTTNRSHEAEKYRFDRPGRQGFFIDSAVLNDNNTDMNSILAFQVHNDSIHGSDLSFHLNPYFVYEGEDGKNPDGSMLSWQFSYRSIVPVDSSALPIIMIETDEYGFGDPYDTFNIYPHMDIVANNSGAYNKPTDEPLEYNGHIRGRIRGNLSRKSPKLSYSIETQLEDSSNNNVSLVGLPEENDWVLYGPYIDKSLIRNEIVFGLGREMGHYEPRTRFCELMLNGQNMGLYVLTERIKRDRNRIDISTLNPWETSGNDLTGGYIFRFDPGYLEIIYPDPDYITPEQHQYMNAYFDTCQSVLNSNSFSDPERGYRRYYDVPSLIDFMIITELTMNDDGYIQSMYFYKDRNDVNPKITSGPLWDYDLSMETNLTEQPPHGWQFENRTSFHNLDVDRFLQDTAFVHDLAGRWHSLRQGILHTDSVIQRIDDIITPIRSYIDRNYMVWPSMHKPVLQFYDLPRTNYQEEIDTLKDWLTERMAWIDENIDDVQVPLVIYPSKIVAGESVQARVTVYPNPFTEKITLEIHSDIRTEAKMLLYDITGRVMYSSHEWLYPGRNSLELHMETQMKEGMYILEVRRHNEVLSVQKIFKVKK